MKAAIPVTTTVLPKPVDAAQLSLNSFRDLANTADALQVSHDGCAWQVAGVAASGAEHMAIDSKVDTTAVFIKALGEAFSRGIQEVVVRELNLRSNPGQPLSARLVRQAIAMAETSRQALQGVDFMTQLNFSAAVQSAEFVDACHAAGLAPAAVSAAQRAAIDARMQQRFTQAAQHNQMPVAPETARQWLQQELAALHAQPPEAS